MRREGRRPARRSRGVRHRVRAWCRRGTTSRRSSAGPTGLLGGRRARRAWSSSARRSRSKARPSCARMLAARGVEMLAAPVSGNAKVIKAGRLSFVCSGPGPRSMRRCRTLRLIAPAASYVGEGELARIVKICHNVFLGVVTQSLAEITVLAQKAGVPRHAFLEFMNQSVMGSTFSRYKTPALVNLDFKVTFTPQAAAQGPRSRTRRGAALRRADAARLDHARPGADADRPRHGRRGLREADRAAGARRRASSWSRRTCRSTTA